MLMSCEAAVTRYNGTESRTENIVAQREVYQVETLRVTDMHLLRPTTVALAFSILYEPKALS